MYKLLLAFQYISSRPIQLLGVFGVALGVWALIVIVSIFTGFIVEVSTHLRGVTGDLKVTGITEDIDGGRLMAILEDDPEVASFTPRYVWYGLLYPSSAQSDRQVGTGGDTNGARLLGLDSRFVSVVGIDAEREHATTAFPQWLRLDDGPERAGSALELAERAENWVLPSGPRARLEGIAAGDELILATAREPQDSDVSYATKTASLVSVGTFETDHAGFDGFTVFADIDYLRRLLKVPADAINEVSVRLRDPARSTEVAQRLEAEMYGQLKPTWASIRVQTWQEINQLALAQFEHQRGLMQTVLLVILVVAAFLIYATLSMMVTEKTRDIGILTALGGTPGGVSGVFLLCGLVVSGLGACIGAVAGCVSAINLERFNQVLRDQFDIDLFPAQVYFLKRVPYSLDPVWILLVVAIAMGFGVLAAAIPAIRAARQDPLRSLRYE